MDSITLPTFLYRGDDDKKGKRKLRETLHHGQLNTHLLNGGDGSRIFREPIWNLVNEHVLSKYERSDFLSFTSDKRAAFRFGLDLQTINDEIIEEGCEAFYDNGTEWDFAILTLNMSTITIISEPSAGIYEGHFYPTLLEFRPYGFYRIFLIDIEKALNAVNDDSFKLSIEYSGYDKEWLVLPAMPKLFINRVENSAIMDTGCITNIEKFKVDRDMVDQFNIITY